MDSKESHSDIQVEDTEKNITFEQVQRDPVREKKILRKVDWRMLPLLGLLYAVSLIDRTNLGLARVAGMGRELKLTIGDRYSIASLTYFIPYIIFQLPSNLILRWVGVRNALTFYVVAWGLAQLGMGFVKQWGYLVLCRVLLGLFEAGFFPALVFVVSTWYRRDEVQKRLAGFYLTSIFISGFSSIFAYVLTLLNGTHGYAGWRWIFIIEGVITIGLGLLTWLFICDFPDRNKFLTPEETQIVLKRVEEDRGDSVPDEITRQKVFKHLGDWTIWAYGLMFMCSTTPAYAVGFFITLILNGMGFSTTDSFLLGAPPYAFAAISCYAFAYVSDHYRRRAPFLAIQSVITIVGLVVTLYAKQNGARYFGLFLTNAGASGCVPGVLAYSANNVVSQSKRAVSTAVIISFGGIGGILATTVFREKDYPRYENGMWATIGCQFLLLSLLAATSLNFYRKNKEARANGTILEDRPGFYYTL